MKNPQLPLIKPTTHHFIISLTSLYNPVERIVDTSLVKIIRRFHRPRPADSMLQSMMGSYPSSKAGWAKAIIIFTVIFVGIVVTRQVLTASSEPGVSSVKLNRKTLDLATWNIAAINNNPFEYWITSNDSNYLSLMTGVSEFVDHPSAAQDVRVADVFTERMANELFALMAAAKWTGINETMAYWHNDYSNRSIISGFLKDEALGRKRLTSMPDRMTNTIAVSSPAEGSYAYRPTVINCYAGRLDSLAGWWTAWTRFMFRDKLHTKGSSTSSGVLPYQLLAPISRAKYPSISKEEAAVSLPLQTLSLAIFDAVLVHMMHSLGSAVWQPIRSSLCSELNHKKNDRTLQILETAYGAMDAIFLQEVAANFRAVAARRKIGDLFEIHQPEPLDADRDQNSFILLQKGRYADVKEVTGEVLKFLNTSSSAKAPVARGDLLVLLATDRLDRSQYIFASFHGDTNGLASKPVVAAVHAYALSAQPKSKLLFGLDANTYAVPEADQQGVTDFAAFYSAHRLNSCYGPAPNPFNFTTFNARTHLQPQLNKAVAFKDKDRLGDKNPKDFILFFAADYTVQAVGKDNTGERRYIDGMVFPTLSFPSDHGITFTQLEETLVQ